MRFDSLPRIIQGGMGVGVSGWPLARAVAELGQLGVVSGTAIDVVLVRRLQLGGPGRHMRRALEHLPIAGVAQRIVERYFVEGGKAAREAFKAKPVPDEKGSQHLVKLLVAANLGSEPHWRDSLP